MENSIDWPVRKALTTPILVMGTERPLLILNVVICIAFVFATRFTWPAFLGILLFVIIHGFCLMISKHDARAVAVFKRSTRYKGFYPAQPGIARTYSRKFNAFPDDIKNKL